MDQERVKELVNETVSENESLFLVELTFLPNNKIKVIVDGDEGISLKECVRISRHVEHSLDREEEDFALEVTSPYITQPLTLQRQYLKNIGRTLKVKTPEGEIEGELANVTEESIELRWKAREPKPIGKGKTTVEKQAIVEYSNIKEAKVKIIF